MYCAGFVPCIYLVLLLVVEERRDALQRLPLLHEHAVVLAAPATDAGGIEADLLGRVLRTTEAPDGNRRVLERIARRVAG